MPENTFVRLALVLVATIACALSASAFVGSVRDNSCTTSVGGGASGYAIWCTDNGCNEDGDCASATAMIIVGGTLIPVAYCSCVVGGEPTWEGCCRVFQKLTTAGTPYGRVSQGSCSKQDFSCPTGRTCSIGMNDQGKCSGTVLPVE